jgi:hypothetical protein
LPPAPAGKRRSRTPLIVVGLVLVVAVVVGAIAILSGGDDTTTTMPTRKALADALLPIRVVRETLSDDWQEDEVTDDGDLFCEQFGLVEPTRSAERLFFTESGLDTAEYTNTSFYEGIGAFETEDEAMTYFQQDAAITSNCRSSEGDLGGTPITYTITDATDLADDLGRDVLAIKYEAAPTAGGDVLLTGYVVETRVGNLIYNTNGAIYGAPADDEYTDSFFAITRLAFERADAEL